MYEICISFLRRGIARAKSPILDGLDSRRSSIVSLVEQHPDGTSIKRGPREQLSNRVQDIGAEHDLLQDYCSTLRGMLGADIVTIIGLEDFNIYTKSDLPSPDLITLISAFNHGTPFPDHVEPIVLASHGNDRVPLTAYSCPANAPLHLGPPARSSMAGFLKKHLQSRKFWWERDPKDDAAGRLMDLLPDPCQTAMSIVYFTPDATPKFVTLAGWNRPFSTFDETSVSYLHFAWVLHGSLRSALAVRRNRWMESSHLTYANTQAHNLKTPLHHILAVTQILRSSITDLAEQRNEQVKDLLPLMDAIDTSGSHLQSIIDNILSFLELKGMERIALSGEKNTYTAHQAESELPLGPMLEEVVATTYEAEARARKARGEPSGRIETIFEVASDELAMDMVEDGRGLLRAVMVKLLANAYKAAGQGGRVGVMVDWDAQGQSDGEGVVKLTISDDGPGMSHTFVQERLGDPWAKEDPNATGSGLSVYLAFRMVDLLHGSMEIQSAPGKGTTVTVVVPLSRQESVRVDHSGDQARHVSLVGFTPPLDRVLRIEMARSGVTLAEPSKAELVIADGILEETIEGTSILSDGRVIVYLVFSDHVPLKEITDTQVQLGMTVRRVQKPATPRVIKEALRLDLMAESRSTLDGLRPGKSASTGSIPTTRVGDMSHADVGDLIAGLALGQVPAVESPRSPNKSTESLALSTIQEGKPGAAEPSPTSKVARPDASPIQPIGDSDIPILVVEDNTINRKILVKILKSRKSEHPSTILEAEDGEQAVEMFKGLNRPSIVLLDINMPKLDGFGACTLMRSIEDQDNSRGKSQIIAITAMSGEADRQRGIGECGMTAWLCKPISKPTVIKVVNRAVEEITRERGDA